MIFSMYFYVFRPPPTWYMSVDCDSLNPLSLIDLSPLPCKQIPTQSMSFETFSWGSILKRLRQMLITGSKMEDGMNWSTRLEAAPTADHKINRSLANYLCLRGKVLAVASSPPLPTPSHSSSHPLTDSQPSLFLIVRYSCGCCASVGCGAGGHPGVC
jgi:hypothetical protein